MPSADSAEERINELFREKLKEYRAYDHTLDAVAAFRFILEYVTEIAEETDCYDFRPKIAPAAGGADAYTPDGLIRQKPSYSFLLELKTSWNTDDISQVVKYAKSPGSLRDDGSTEGFGENHCVLLGYQNTPGETNLEKLFDAWNREKFAIPLVVFRYSLEVGPEADQVFFSWVPFQRNGHCPPSTLGRAINSPRGYPVSVDQLKFVRPRFHKANDQLIPSYAAVLWWTAYARHYLTDDQKAEMAARGRLKSPLVIPLDRLAEVPIPEGVEVPLRAHDVSAALEFLRQARLVTLKKRAGFYEVELKEDRYIRFPYGSNLTGPQAPQEIARKILVRWATHKIKHPVPEPRRKRPALAKLRKVRSRRSRDRGTLPLFGGGNGN